ncbi:MAG: DUF4230 domain-containing protein [Bacteroidaceae bacterium]|nr:DUF4230 domain-containing protein [Bacteroidaceae bacterium]MCF0185228.1 DUF4230 domain-containing protein [Bacteroidaceae bacterium]MCF0186212.1 DUF4230 domain-containing protein [Bacteroidaceae bacterium]
MGNRKVRQYIAATISIVVVLLAILLSVVRCETKGSGTLAQTDAVAMGKDPSDLPQLILKIQQCSRLYGTEYKVHKIITHEDQKVLKVGGMTFDIPLTDRHIAIPMDATLKAYVDLEQFTDKNIATDGSRIVITLPEPRIEVTSTIVQHDQTQEHVALVRQNYSAKEQEDLHRQGLVAITENALKNGILENARVSVARTLVPMLQQMGYEDRNIEVRFSKEAYDLNDLPALLDSKTIKFNR